MRSSRSLALITCVQLLLNLSATNTVLSLGSIVPVLDTFLHLRDGSRNSKEVYPGSGCKCKDLRPVQPQMQGSNLQQIPERNGGDKKQENHGSVAIRRFHTSRNREEIALHETDSRGHGIHTSRDALSPRLNRWRRHDCLRSGNPWVKSLLDFFVHQSLGLRGYKQNSWLDGSTWRRSLQHLVSGRLGCRKGFGDASAQLLQLRGGGRASRNLERRNEMVTQYTLLHAHVYMPM